MKTSIKKLYLFSLKIIYSKLSLLNIINWLTIVIKGLRWKNINYYNILKMETKFQNMKSQI